MILGKDEVHGPEILAVLTDPMERLAEIFGEADAALLVAIAGAHPENLPDGIPLHRMDMADDERWKLVDDLEIPAFLVRTKEGDGLALIQTPRHIFSVIDSARGVRGDPERHDAAALAAPEIAKAMHHLGRAGSKVDPMDLTADEHQDEIATAAGTPRSPPRDRAIRATSWNKRPR